MDAEEQKAAGALVLSAALGLSIVLLAAAVLIGVINGSRDLSELGVRALTVGFAACSGVLGFELGKRAKP